MEIYTVCPGDTLESIAACCGLSPMDLAAYNGLSDQTRLSRGMALLLPSREDETKRREAELLAFACPGVNHGILSETAELMTYICDYCASILPEGDLSAPSSQGMAETAVGRGALPLLTISNIDNERGGFSPQAVHALLMDVGARERFRERLSAVVDEGGYLGALLHFQYLLPFDREAYAVFLSETSRFLHSKGLYTLASIAPCGVRGDTGILSLAQDRQAMAECCDTLILLSGALGGDCGEESAMPRLRETLDNALEEIAPGKLLMELPRRAVDRLFHWQGGTQSRTLPFATAADMAAALDTQPRYDPLAASTVFTYTDPSGYEHRVWYEDARGIQARSELIKDYALAGAALFCDNYLFPTTLKILDSMFVSHKLI